MSDKTKNFFDIIEAEKKEVARLRGQVDDLLKIESGMSAWEMTFVDSVSHWIGDFTDKQIEMIDQLYDKHC